METTMQHAEIRRSANYQPSVCNHESIHSLDSDYKGDAYSITMEELKEYTKHLLEGETHPVRLLELVDNLQRLGVAYLFDEHIKAALKSVVVEAEGGLNEEVDIYTTALKFRLLRQHGFMIPQDVFTIFMDEKGSFQMNLCRDINGILGLYEASYLGLEGETILDKGRIFALTHLKDYADQKWPSPHTDQQKRKVEHALELPYHWASTRLEAVWFIEMYENEEIKNPKLLQLAKLDFNTCQAMYQNELKVTFEFGDLCKGFLKEAQWYYEAYTPTLDEYLSNGLVTIGAPAILSCAYFSMKLGMTESELEILCSYPDVIKWSSIICRLCDDLGTAKDEMARGDVPKAVQCYMHETGVGEEVAREHVKDLILDAWKKLNKELICDSPLPRAFVEATMHAARTFHRFYQFGDGFASIRDSTKLNFKKLVVESLPI
ncbi:hypothetical protein H6P81_017427 [Aristolochia fimbriata]|uniref:(+)-delta-cadinene synthase n=1 Tax=Aristolochia fimbriata TaxID=158543 RepID=A0AAV7E2F7_ARIFI|nr:hypothetical protein H6P81_017427 [Aristolochia fimbriata]